jgi:hypothetical protein
MSFIEVHNDEGKKVTVNTDYVVTFTPRKGVSGTDIQLNPGSVHGAARQQVTEGYDQVRRLVGLDWLTCGETFQGDICDRRLDKEGRCPIHGMVGA